MRRISLLALFIALLAPVLVAAPAHAQATRTWVSGVGDDANPCSRTAPCKTFAGAISKTAAAGEINCLDPGGFGGVTITKAMTLNCSATLGSILVAGTPGITINAGAGDAVILRGIQIQGINGTATPGTIGIRILVAGAVVIEDSVITQSSQQGILDSRTSSSTNPRLEVRNSVISLNVATGITLGSATIVKAQIERSSFVNNGFGLAVGSGSVATVTRSVFTGNTTGIEADGGGSITADSISVTHNTTGVQSNGSIRLSNSDVTNNATGFNGTATSYQNNRLQGNATFGTAVANISQQ